MIRIKSPHLPRFEVFYLNEKAAFYDDAQEGRRCLKI